MIVEATSVQTSALRTLAEALKGILIELSLVFDVHGIHMTTMDTSQVVLAQMSLRAENFEKYVYNNPSSPKLVIGLNTEHFCRLIKTAGNDDTLTLYIDEEDPNVLGIRMEDAKKKQITRYKMNLLDRDESSVEIPANAFAQHITMPSADFQKICRDMTQLGAKTTEIQKLGASLTFSCKGQFASRITTLGDIDTIYGVPGGGPKKDVDIVSGKFSLLHLSLFTKCTPLCNNLEIYLKNGYFMMIKYGIANLGEIKLCLTPTP